MHTRVGTDQRRRTSAYAAVICAATFSVLLAACSGSSGAQGPAGAAGATGATGPAGSTGPVTALSITSATSITGTITGVTVGGPPVVNFQLVDENGAPLTGLPAADIGFVIAKLTPGTNGTSSYWTSYIYQTVTPSGCPTGVTACDTTPKTQPTTESGATGKLVDNGNGTYVYTFAKDITTDPLVTYDATLTHRVGVRDPRARPGQQRRLHLPALDRRDHRHLQPRDRRDLDLRHLPRLPQRARRRARRGALLRDVPQPAEHRPLQRQHARLQADDPQDPHGHQSAEHQPAGLARAGHDPDARSGLLDRRLHEVA